MTDEMKLLRAFIEVSGYKIETKETFASEYHCDDIVDGNPKFNAMPINIVRSVEYTVAKKNEGDL